MKSICALSIHNLPKNLAVGTLSVLVVATMGFSCPPSPSVGRQAPSSVKVEHDAKGFRLVRNGKPYRILGVGGDGNRELFVSLGGNSIRTWGADNLGEVLDEAQKEGLTVTAGIWLGHREYFNYHDAKAVAKQFDMCRDIVRKYKDHPALLAWAFGNEAEGDGKDPETFKAINDLAVMSHQEDPNHPAMTVMAEIGDGKLESIQKYCPDLDLIGINSYGGGPSLAERYKKSGYQKPYVVTEFGPPGPWEVGKTSWGAALELTSTAKSVSFEKTYRSNVIDNSEFCLGSYAFLWGHKLEGTPTWFGMFLSDGTKLAAIDTISALWKGKAPTSDCPAIQPIQLDGLPEQGPGGTLKASVQVQDPSGGNPQINWTLIKELKETGGDNPTPVETIPNSIRQVDGDASRVSITLPNVPGVYRLMVVARTPKGAATANVPLHVKAVVKIDPNIPNGKLPLVVFDEANGPGLFSPTGWMGDTASMKLEQASTDTPHSGATCMKFSFENPINWGGIAWQYPANDWGDKVGSINLKGAKRLSFWLRGGSGGEKVKVQFGILGKDKTYPDSGSGSAELTLTNDWKQFSIDVSGQDMSRIKTGFVLVVAGNGHPQTVYVDGIRYE